MHNLPFQNKILGGIHIVSIHDQHGNLIFKEKKQSAETFRPWFISNCTEAVQNVEIIAEMFENELLECSEMDFEFNGKNYTTELQIYTMMDSKLIDLATGLGGAYW